MIVITLEENGLPNFSSSPTAYKEALEKCLNTLEQKHGKPIGIIDKSFGRATYHFALFESSKPKSTKRTPSNTTTESEKSDS
jgi:hypothetical protein